MLFSTAVAAAAVFAPLANAHGSLGVPKIQGLDSEQMKSIFASLGSPNTLSSHVHDSHVLSARDSPKECGEGVGSCPQGKCCSEYGYCGVGAKYCYSPGCQAKFGPACPDNIIPKGENTSSIPRPKVGDVPYGGEGIYHCKKPGTVALTFDDGPMEPYTSLILDIFKSYNAKATFFITGFNVGKDQIDETDEFIKVIKRMDSEGHQIGSHTWTHPNLELISQEARYKNMYQNEMAIRNIVGKIPTYMRPPYSSCKEACQKDMADLGYHISNFDIDTDDYNQAPKGKIQTSMDTFKGFLTQEGSSPDKSQWLTISHDIVNMTAYNLTEFMLRTLTDQGYKAVTIGECMNDPVENWYRSSDGSSGSNTGSKSSDPSGTGSANTGGASNPGTQGGSASPSPSVATTQSAASGLALSSLAALSLAAVVAFAFAL
jgi:peptidoglycan/xylan/chitin deacetylase (PgdA/CDA1 family)